MTTPKRKAIIEKALELYEQSNGVMPSITPTYAELLEGGYVYSAQHALMSDEATHETHAHLEKLAHENGYSLKKESRAYLKVCLRHNMLEIPFDMNEAKKSNVLISGTNHSGKSRLACAISSLLTRFNWQIIAFDNSSVWREISDLEYVLTVEGKIPIFEDLNMVYDLSYVTPKNQRKLVDGFFKRYWNLTRRRVKKQRRQTLIVLEEFQMYGRNSRYSDNLARVMCTGRNLKIRVLAVCVDLSLVDPFFIRLCEQRFHARLGIEESSKRKFRNYYGKDWTRIACEIEIGTFIYMNRQKLKLVTVPLFQAKTLPQELNTEKVLAQ